MTYVRCLGLLLLCLPVVAEESFLIRFGTSESTGRTWNGSASVTAGRIAGLRPWQFDEVDAISGRYRWEITTKPDTYWHSPWERSLLGTKRQTKLTQRGILLTVEMTGPGAVRIETTQGNFDFTPASIPWAAPRTFLDGVVTVSRAPRPNRARIPGAQDYVTSLRARDGAEWVAWQTYQNRGDQLWVRRDDRPPEALTPSNADLFRVQLAEGRNGRVHAIWSDQRNGNFDLYARVWNRGSWSPTERLTTSPGSDIFHSAAAGPDGSIHLVWQSMRGSNADIYLKTHDGRRWGDEVRVSTSNANDWEPTVAVSENGRAAIVWDSYASGNYDIFLRSLDDGRLTDPITVAATPSFEARPRALFDAKGRLWLAWEEGDPQWGKDYVNTILDAGMGLLMRRQVRVAVYENGRLRQPMGDLAAALPAEYRTAFLEPRLVLDSSGAPWVFFRYRTNTPVRPQPTYRSMWRLGASTHRNGQWSPLIRFAEGFGRIDSATSAHVAADGDIEVHWVSDGRPFPQAFPAEQDLYSATISPTGPTDPPPLEDFRFRTESFLPTHPNEAEDVARLRAYRATIGGKTYRIVRGDMHRHTDVSWDGNRDGSLFDAYRYALDAAAHDFLGVADHNAGADVEYHWWMIQKAVDLLSISGHFAPLYGYERSRSYPSGHRNVMFAQRGVPVLKHTAAERTDNANTSVAHLYEHLRKERGIVMSHTSGTGAGTDWRDSDPEVETLMEVYQGYRTSYEHEGAPRSTTRGARPAGFVWKAWEKGIKLGLQSSSDHVSTHASHGMIYVDELTREAILDGIRARRAYAATDNILVDFRLNGALMGSAITASGNPKIEAKITGTGAIAKVEIIRNNEYIHTQPGGPASLEFTYTDTAPPAGEKYYYIRIEQNNGELAWASPVWVTPPR